MSLAAPRVGLTLPSFVRDPEEALTVATAAEAAGLDGVFVYDHLFRVAADGTYRPALEMTALLGAVAAETSRLTIGVLVTRASLRPPAVTALTLETVQRISGGRVVTALGSGDAESRPEHQRFGLPFGTIDDRLAGLRAAIRSTRGQGFPVWIGGTHPAVRALAAAEADGWNRWGGDAARFGEEAAAVADAAVRAPFACTWGGLVVLAAADDGATEKAARLGARPGTIVGGVDTVAAALADYAAAGAAWVVAGPVDAGDPANAALLAEIRAAIPARLP